MRMVYAGGELVGGTHTLSSLEKDEDGHPAHDGHVDTKISGTIHAKNGASRPFLKSAES